MNKWQAAHLAFEDNAPREMKQELRQTLETVRQRTPEIEPVIDTLQDGIMGMGDLTAADTLFRLFVFLERKGVMEKLTVQKSEG